MKMSEYQQYAVRTSAFYRNQVSPYSGGIAINDVGRRLLTASYGLAEEWSEGVLGLVKKTLGHGHPFPVEKASKELGDVLWYLSELTSACGKEMADQEFDECQQLVCAQIGDWKYIPQPNEFTPESLDFHVHIANAIRASSGIVQLVHLMVCHGQRTPMTALFRAIIDNTNFWFMLVGVLGLSAEKVALDNIAKLKARYPAGFETAKSIDRAAEEAPVLGG